jgi:hypothetical protein
MADSSLPFVTAYGNLTKALERIKRASTPPRFTQDFLATKLNLKGGSARPVIPFLGTFSVVIAGPYYPCPVAHEEPGWVEINITVEVAPAAFLVDTVDPLVREFAEEFETWHFFWEPEGLRLRFHWQDLSRQIEIEDRLAEILDRWQSEGRFREWWFGHHGTRGLRHEGEAEAYGPEVWDLLKKEWEISSELAVRLAVLGGDAGLTGTEHRTAFRHWERHVHLHTNRQFLSLEAEVGLSMMQASGYLGNLVGAENDLDRRAWLANVKARLDEALGVWLGKSP